MIAPRDIIDMGFARIGDVPLVEPVGFREDDWVAWVEYGGKAKRTLVGDQVVVQGGRYGVEAGIDACVAALSADLGKPTIPEVLPLVVAYCAKPENSVGGSLHIVLEDGNVADSHVAFCREWAADRGDDDGVRLAELLLLMSKTQRSKLARLWS